MKFEMPNEENGKVDEYYLKKLETDVNTGHSLNKGEEKESKRILLTYVDDLMIIT